MTKTTKRLPKEYISMGFNLFMIKPRNAGIINILKGKMIFRIRFHLTRLSFL